jgi:hypothetical protein
MFVVTEADSAAIRTAYEQEGELSAAIELRRLFPGITDNAEARACAPDHRWLETAARCGLSEGRRPRSAIASEEVRAFLDASGTDYRGRTGARSER